MLRGTPLLIAAAVLACLALQCPATGARARAANGLQLRLIVPDDTAVGDRLPIDVSFRGAVPTTFEMYLDGSLVAKRQVTGAGEHGVVSFSLDTMLLAEGTHALQIRAEDADGKMTVASGHIRVPGVDLSAPVRIAYPANGLEISGVVPIRVGLSNTLAQQNPYVTFFVDRELKVLRNYPPYEYNWDTTTVANGWHLLEAWTQLPDAASPFKARPIHVSVNNSGGATKKQDTIEDLRAKPAITMPIAPSHVAGTAPALSVDASDRASRGMSTKAAGSAGLRAMEPEGRRFASQAAPGARPAFRAASAKPGRLAPSMAGGAVVVPQGRLMIASRAVATTSNLAEYGLPETKPSFSPTVRVRPGESVQSISKRTGVSATEIRRLNSIEPTGTLKAGQKLIVPQSGMFTVAMNGSEIAFDVPPRIERGVALAPFRSIFEYAGGTLYWYAQAKRVHAINSTREVEIQIGSKRALVNNHPLDLERRAYIDRGRTIVPMSFIGNVLDVSMSYDSKSGRLMLQSK